MKSTGTHSSKGLQRLDHLTEHYNCKRSNDCRWHVPLFHRWWLSQSVVSNPRTYLPDAGWSTFSQEQTILTYQTRILIHGIITRVVNDTYIHTNDCIWHNLLYRLRLSSRIQTICQFYNHKIWPSNAVSGDFGSKLKPNPCCHNIIAMGTPYIAVFVSYRYS